MQLVGHGETLMDEIKRSKRIHIVAESVVKDEVAKPVKAESANFLIQSVLGPLPPAELTAMTYDKIKTWMAENPPKDFITSVTTRRMVSDKPNMQQMPKPSIKTNISLGAGSLTNLTILVDKKDMEEKTVVAPISWREQAKIDLVKKLTLSERLKAEEKTIALEAQLKMNRTLQKIIARKKGAKK